MEFSAFAGISPLLRVDSEAIHQDDFAIGEANVSFPTRGVHSECDWTYGRCWRHKDFGYSSLDSKYSTGQTSGNESG